MPSDSLGLGPEIRYISLFCEPHPLCRRFGFPGQDSRWYDLVRSPYVPPGHCYNKFILENVGNTETYKEERDNSPKTCHSEAVPVSVSVYI